MKTILTASAFILAATSAMANPNQACTTGNAAFCNITGPQGPAGPAGANGTDGGFSGTIQAPAGIRPVAIGNGTPAQGVVRFDGPDGQTYHVVNQQTVFKRYGGGTATVNAGDRITNAHEAEIRNRAALIASLPPVEHPDYSDTFAAYDAEISDLRALGENAMYAASGAVALAQIDLPHTGGIGVSVSSVDGYGSFAVKGGYAVTTNVTISAGVFTSAGGSGGAVAAVWGF